MFVKDRVPRPQHHAIEFDLIPTLYHCDGSREVPPFRRGSAAGGDVYQSGELHCDADILTSGFCGIRSRIFQEVWVSDFAFRKMERAARVRGFL